MGLSYTELDDIYTVPSRPTPMAKKTYMEFDGIHFVFLYIVALFIFSLK
jgi:hypothetical protein